MSFILSGPDSSTAKWELYQPLPGLDQYVASAQYNSCDQEIFTKETQMPKCPVHRWI